VTKGKSLASRLRGWYVLAENLRPQVGRFPQLAADLEELAAMHAEASALISELVRLRSEARGATSRLRKLARRGDMLRTRMGAGLRSSLGFEAVELIQYGFRPRRSVPGDEAVKALRRKGAVMTQSSETGAASEGAGEFPAEISDERSGSLAGELLDEPSAEPS